MSSVLDAWRDRRAAKRLLGRLIPQPATANKFTVQAWLWSVIDEPAMVGLNELAASQAKDRESAEALDIGLIRDSEMNRNDFQFFEH